MLLGRKGGEGQGKELRTHVVSPAVRLSWSICMGHMKNSFSTPKKQNTLTQKYLQKLIRDFKNSIKSILNC